MWKQLGSFALQLFTLTQSLNAIKTEQAEIREELKDIHRRLLHLAYVVEGERKDRNHEAETLILRLELRLKELEHRLPPPPRDDEPKGDTMNQATVETPDQNTALIQAELSELLEQMRVLSEQTRRDREEYDRLRRSVRASGERADASLRETQKILARLKAAR